MCGVRHHHHGKGAKPPLHPVRQIRVIVTAMASPSCMMRLKLSFVLLALGKIGGRWYLLPLPSSSRLHCDERV